MSLLFCGSLAAQSTTAAGKPQSAKAPAAAPLRASARPEPYIPEQFPKRAREYYAGAWGVDSLGVKYAESGELIRFNFRVLDPRLASPLNDKKFEPSLIAPRAGVRLTIPSLEKVGQLRQSGTPEAGKIYWMAFSNKGRRVQRGDRVSVVIGRFHADNLLVQ
jgi:hypothetical protein